MKILMGTFIGLLIGLGLMIFQELEWETQYNDMVTEYNTQLQLADTQIKNLDSLLSMLQEQNQSLELTLQEAFKKIDLLVTFRDAGLTMALQVEDVRELLELTDLVPYGSLFKNGHWISSKYGLRDESQIKGDNYTEGIDLVGKGGDRIIRTPMDGAVTDYGVSEVYGRWIEVSNSRFKVKVGHLSKIYWQDLDTHVVKGVPLVKGDKIGVMGNTGITYSDNGGDGSHADYRMWVWDDESEIWLALNPTSIIAYTGGDKEATI